MVKNVIDCQNESSESNETPSTSKKIRSIPDCGHRHDKSNPGDIDEENKEGEFSPSPSNSGAKENLS